MDRDELVNWTPSRSSNVIDQLPWLEVIGKKVPAVNVSHLSSSIGASFLLAGTAPRRTAGHSFFPTLTRDKAHAAMAAKANRTEDGTGNGYRNGFSLSIRKENVKERDHELRREEKFSVRINVLSFPWRIQGYIVLGTLKPPNVI